MSDAHDLELLEEAVISLVVAHQGGWDEILFVALPVVLFAGLLAIANRRATRELARREEERASGREASAPDPE